MHIIWEESLNLAYVRSSILLWAEFQDKRSALVSALSHLTEFLARRCNLAPLPSPLPLTGAYSMHADSPQSKLRQCVEGLEFYLFYCALHSFALHYTCIALLVWACYMHGTP